MGIPELFPLEARASGGISPYFYEWTFTWNKDTLRTQIITIRPETSGEVKLKVTDSSFPAKSKDAIYQIREIILTADFTIDAGSSCAQIPIKFTPFVTGGTPDYKYLWDFGDGYTSNENNPAHEFIASACSGTSSFNVRMVVTDADGCSVAVNKIVSVKNKPFLNFTDTENPFSPFKHCPEILIDPTFDIVLENNSLQTSCIGSYKVDWGDGSSVVNNATFPLRHTYTKAGAFELTIMAGNVNGCDLVWKHFVYNQSSPAAGIESYGGTEGCVPVEFAFGLIGYENNSIGTTYTWDFGDGSPVVVWDHSEPFINDSIRHVYLKTSCDNESGPGYFSTYVTVKNGCDTKTAAVDKVRIWSKPEASIDDGDLTIDTICVNETISLNNNSTNGYYGSTCTRLSQYAWDFGNGITSAAEQMPPMSWSVPGEYDIVLKIKNPCGETLDTFKIAVVQPPDADASVDITSGCSPFKPKFNNNSTGSKKYLWKIKPDSGYSFLNGTTEKSPEPEISINEAGIYHVVLYASNACQTDSVLFDVNVFTIPDGSIVNLNNICITDPIIHPSVNYDDNGSPVASFSWSFVGGSPVRAPTEDPGEHIYGSTGEYTVSLVLENACGSRNLESVFHVQPKPEVTAITQVSICESESISITGTTAANVASFKWQTLGDGYFNDISLLNPVYYPGPSDLINAGTSLLIVATGASSCNSDTAVINLAIQKKPWVKPDNNVTVCERNGYNIINTTAGNYDVLQWSTSGDGYFSDPAILLPVYYPGNNDISRGNVVLTLTAQAIGPCLLNASGTFVITYARVPTLDAGPDRDICKNGQVSLSASGTGLTSVTWHVENGAGSFSDPSGLDPVFTLSPGFSDSLLPVIVEAAGGYGCPIAYDTLELTVIPFPVVSAGVDAIVCESGSLEITDASVQEYFDYSWIVNGDGTLNDNSVLNPVYTPGSSDIANGKVILTLIAKGNSVCPDVSDTMTISIQKLPVSDAGEDQEVCKSNSFITTGSQEYGASYQWITSGTGTFEDQTKLITTYYPSDNDKDKGSVELVLKVNGIALCFSPANDTVKLTFIDPPILSAGNDTTICSSSFKPGSAYSFNSTQYEWLSSGSGTWTDKNTLTPAYYPSASDNLTGSVVLTLTSKNPSCPPVSDDMILNLTPFPVADAGSDEVICEDYGKPLVDSYSANFSAVEWRTSGDGNFSDKTDLHPVYYTGINDIGNGNVKLYLIATGMPPCNTSEIDSITISIQKNPVVYAGPDTVIGERELFTAISATAQNVNQVSWSTLGDGTFLNSSGIITTYIHGDNDLKNKGVKLIIRGTSNSPCVKVVTDTILVLITPKPAADAGADEKICEGSAVTISTASAQEYSEIWWTTKGTGVFENDSTLTPTYHPGDEDIDNRIVVLELHARGKDPLEDLIVSDTMLVNIIHNASADVKLSDTTCVNSSYQIRDIIYRDANIISWSSSGDGFFTGTEERNPMYGFSSNDRNKDIIYFYVKVSSISPCVHVENDTMTIRLYHEPQPSFDYFNQEGCAPLKVSLANTSAGEELTYYWDFGNGLESYSEEPGDVVFQQGKLADTTYTLTLNATNRCGTSSTRRDVTVKPVPVADFGMDVAWGCSPKEIQFFNVTGGLADTYLWKWGDGKADSGIENPGTHIFETGEADTSYTITLIARNECGVDSMQKSVIIFPNKVRAFFETDTTMGCAPLKVSFVNYSRGVLGNRPFLNWSWNFGDGNITDELNPVHTFTKPGKYKVTLYVNDTCSYDSFTTEINVMGAPRADFVTDKTDYCEDDTVFVSPINMTINEIAGVTWDFGDSTQGFDFTDQHFYDTTGIFTIILTAKDIISGCTASISKNINIHQSPVAAFSIPQNDHCQTLQITFLNLSKGADYFSWDFGNGNRSIDVNGQQLFNEPGTYKITLSATDIRGCVDTASRPLNVNPKPVSAFQPSSLKTCFTPVDLEFTNLSEGADDYRWNLGNGFLSKDTNPVITYNEAGDYHISLIATNKYNCSDTSELVYHAYDNPVAEFTVDSIIGCDPFKVQFINLTKNGLEYYWNFNDQGYSKDEEPSFTFEGTGKYTVGLKVVGQGGCKDSILKEDFITTNPSPISDFDYTKINGLDTVQFHNYSSGAISYVWNFDDGQLSEEENPWHRYTTNGTYKVSLTSVNEYNCKNTKFESIDFVMLKGLFLPNALSPGNASKEVAEFKAIGTGLLKYHLVIYDAWGNLIWETTKLERGMPVEAWDGTLNGKALPPDVYVWHLKEVIFEDGKAYTGPRYGSITLLK